MDGVRRCLTLLSPEIDKLEKDAKDFRDLCSKTDVAVESINRMSTLRIITEGLSKIGLDAAKKGEELKEKMSAAAAKVLDVEQIEADVISMGSNSCCFVVQFGIHKSHLECVRCGRKVEFREAQGDVAALHNILEKECPEAMKKTMRDVDEILDEANKKEEIPQPDKTVKAPPSELLSHRAGTGYLVDESNPISRNHCNHNALHLQCRFCMNKLYSGVREFNRLWKLKEQSEDQSRRREEEQPED